MKLGTDILYLSLIKKVNQTYAPFCTLQPWPPHQSPHHVSMEKLQHCHTYCAIIHAVCLQFAWHFFPLMYWKISIIYHRTPNCHISNIHCPICPKLHVIHEGVNDSGYTHLPALYHTHNASYWWQEISSTLLIIILWSLQFHWWCRHYTQHHDTLISGRSRTPPSGCRRRSVAEGQKEGVACWADSIQMSPRLSHPLQPPSAAWVDLCWLWGPRLSPLVALIIIINLQKHF